MMIPDISIIIPVYNEAGKINEQLEYIQTLEFSGKIQVIVVDGHPRQTTLDQIHQPGMQNLVGLGSLAGRGAQMNRGARQTTAKILLFLHCDTQLPQGALDAVLSTMRDPNICAGAFDLAIDHPSNVFRMIEKSASIRSRLTRIPYGDQAIFIKKNCFDKIGGFQPIPIMEDVDLMRCIKRRGKKIKILRMKAITSARRWQKEGILYGTLRNWLLLTLYYLGISSEKLVRFYRKN